MIDLLILCLLSWSGILGWRRGGFRALIDSVSVGGASAAAIFLIPLLRDHFIDGGALEFRKWLREHIRSVPTGFGLSDPGPGVAQNLYHLLIVGIAALAVWIGMQMILQVFQTVWKEPGGTVLSRIAGSLLGIAIGSVLAAYMVKCLGLLSWVQGWEALDLQLARSFFVWIVMNAIAR
ncbi:CvpA family protein [Effusibacillus pohliae]|uniref:CvpA family protein n=1 Tax=Effusibacillus pohliae TaxID=232270 RepID=UPI000360C409|nr:CvpA family protein [Effusibacillus pohliae]